MAYVKKLFNENFLYYASYVIKDRAIPDLEDGLKPVQRRIMHTLFDVDDGKFHKVANLVGHCMKYHPHGDASIYSALVVLANKELFIEKQGNFGNLFTGDEASAARYIEARVTSFAREILYNPKITEYVDSYDGRNREPVSFPAKLPLILLMGAEGIAVGMSTRILPHNPLEVIKAEIACLKKRSIQLLPDFPTGGIMDSSEYEDGNGRVRVRARLDLSDPKRILIREIPYGTTTEGLIESVESAAKAGRIKIASISDFTTDKVEIEIKLQRGLYAADVVDALYAFTQCEQSISCNFLVIKDGVPVVMSAAQTVKYHAGKILEVLKAELDLRAREVANEIHARTLERIFIEERVYKAIETKKTQEGVRKAVVDGLKPFAKEIKREVTDEDVERLLKIPIRRISLYDIERARAEMDKLKAELKEIRHHLANLTDYAIGFLEGVASRLAHQWKRKTEVTKFGKVAAKEVARRDVALRYDPETGYLGTSVSGGNGLFDVSTFDKLLVMRRSGLYSVVQVPDRLFADKEMLYCAIADKDALADVAFTLVYRDPKNGHPYIKRCRIEAWIMNKDYQIIPDGAKVLYFTTEPKKKIRARYLKRMRARTLSEVFNVADFEVKGLKAQGVRLASREIESVGAVDAENLFEAHQEGMDAADDGGLPRKAKAKARARARGKAAGTSKSPKAASSRKAPAVKAKTKIKSKTAIERASGNKAAKEDEAPRKKPGLLEKAGKIAGKGDDPGGKGRK